MSKQCLQIPGRLCDNAMLALMELWVCKCSLDAQIFSQDNLWMAYVKRPVFEEAAESKNCLGQTLLISTMISLQWYKEDGLEQGGELLV